MCTDHKSDESCCELNVLSVNMTCIIIRQQWSCCTKHCSSSVIASTETRTDPWCCTIYEYL